MKKIITLSAIAAATTMTGCTTLQNVVGHDDTGMHTTHITANNGAPVTSKNGILVDSANHMTLYTYDKDTMNKSNCGNVCLVAWPAFLSPKAVSSDSQFKTITRDDGKYQWAYNGQPLYFYANDTKAGDKHGDDQFGVWHVIPAK